MKERNKIKEKELRNSKKHIEFVEHPDHGRPIQSGNLLQSSDQKECFNDVTIVVRPAEMFNITKEEHCVYRDPSHRGYTKEQVDAIAKNQSFLTIKQLSIAAYLERLSKGKLVIPGSHGGKESYDFSMWSIMTDPRLKVWYCGEEVPIFVPTLPKFNDSGEKGSRFRRGQVLINPNPEIYVGATPITIEKVGENFLWNELYSFEEQEAEDVDWGVTSLSDSDMVEEVANNCEEEMEDVSGPTVQFEQSDILSRLSQNFLEDKLKIAVDCVCKTSGLEKFCGDTSEMKEESVTLCGLPREMTVSVDQVSHDTSLDQLGIRQSITYQPSYYNPYRSMGVKKLSLYRRPNMGNDVVNFPKLLSECSKGTTLDYEQFCSELFSRGNPDFKCVDTMLSMLGIRPNNAGEWRHNGFLRKIRLYCPKVLWKQRECRCTDMWCSARSSTLLLNDDWGPDLVREKELLIGPVASV